MKGTCVSDIRIEETDIEGLFVIEPITDSDKCEDVIEVYNQSVFMSKGLTQHFVQDNEVFSHKGVLRGMHVNLARPQAKLIRVSSGAIFDVVVDLRKGSKTYAQWFGIELSASNRKQLYIPEGMGHGYLALSDAKVIFKTTTHYIPNDEIGFAWNSKALKIQWPLNNIKIIQSDCDRSCPDFSELTL